MSEVLVGARGVSKTFGEQRALADVSLSIDRGEIHALVGENGSGKSTFIKILSGFHTPDRGSEISINGEALDFGSATDSFRHGMRFVHQNLGIVDELDAVDNMGLASGFVTGPAWTVRRGEQEKRARALLAQIGVDVDLTVPAAKLRPVERSALAIARALDAQRGEIRLLVLDEPTAALPPVEVDALFRVIRDIAARGVSVLYVSHRLDEILAIADRVSVLRDGQFQGTFPAAGLSRHDIIRHILGHDLADSSEADEQRRVDAKVTRSGGERPGLNVENLCTTFLQDVSFEVGRGEVLGFAGLDGSGRDELAGALGGAVTASGRVTNGEGRATTKFRAGALRRQGIALVLPNWHPASAIKEFDLRENVTLATVAQTARFGVLRPKAEFDEALRWLTAVDVRPVEPAKIYGELSGGNKQKVIVGRWLATKPGVLVLDDPTSGVDIGARHQMYSLIRDQAARGLSVVLCSSDLEDLVELCDRVACLVNGRISEVLTGDRITEARLLTAITATADEPRLVLSEGSTP